jgi:hypothetical protein
MKRPRKALPKKKKSKRKSLTYPLKNVLTYSAPSTFLPRKQSW